MSITAMINVLMKCSTDVVRYDGFDKLLDFFIVLKKALFSEISGRCGGDKLRDRFLKMFHRVITAPETVTAFRICLLSVIRT
ncbi:hypothetical protein M406DRAFT_355768 [Cryphonectria parasitica EP155]|uniref:Uncharacterized protein n=1 Tax=Cryphonectria parasitica (strain ATCC 38755 / EP155) TaxID=660469 RepID=A0A9P5CS42_CRYP1|nr:uncharacterized protein M406DRAFT_355768 [Cryphonectria parasitica EP155]KAF3767931.1 hypothetical protein M406DRAFT_355768 [Cryphonectria parasitica EP155]